MPETHRPDIADLQTRLLSGPSLRDAASNALRPALKVLYPDLDIDPQLAIVVTPTWSIEEDYVVAGPEQFESLTDVLVRLGVHGTTVTWLDGEHFLTRQPGSEPIIHLPVKIEAVGRLVNELAALLFVAYQEQQLAYWNTATATHEPRWYQLSDALREQWNVVDTQGWDAERLAMARAVYRFPDKRQRLHNDPYKTRMCLIDIDRNDNTEDRHVTVLPIAVLTGTSGQRTIITTCSVTQGFRHFASFDALGNAMTTLLTPLTRASRLKWRLFEPDGNFFDHQACTLLALDADVIGAFGQSLHASDTSVLPVGESLTANKRTASDYEQLRPLLPDWLDSASTADQTCFSRHLLDLAILQNRTRGKSFQHEIPTLHAYTVALLVAQIRKDHPAVSDIRVENIELTITSLVVWGTFVVPGQTETLTLTLIELALQNLAGLPMGIKTVRHVDGSPTPDWMTPQYLETLVTTVDIGNVYPAMLKRRLIEDPVEAPALRKLYTDQLPIELALLALQCKIRGERGLDEQGYRYVVAALATAPGDRLVNGQRIVVRPLAFRAHRTNGSTDTVANMFIIGPEEAEKGSCLLYRPLLDPPLIQYPGQTNLLYAIQHSRTLRQSVLAWLPDNVRFNYSQYVFPGALMSVWTLPQLLVDPTVALDMTGPVSLAHDNALEADVAMALFNANAQAFVAQADRQSVSNAEARWATLRHGGWMLFNAALPFLGRSIGSAAWVWQIMDDLQSLIDAQNETPGTVEWSALTDVLLTLGMILAHRAASNRQTRQRTVIAPEMKPELLKPEVSRLADIGGATFPSTHETSLVTVGALSRSKPTLGMLLDTLKIEKPATLTGPASAGPHQHLYSHGQKWYAPVGERWFEVSINDDDQIQIIDSRQQLIRTGPLLTHNAQGQWFIDLRLRLRGGGLGSRRKKMQQENKQRLNQKKAALAAFEATLEDKQQELISVRKAMLGATPQAAAAARQHFLDTLDTQIRAYAAHSQDLKALNALEPVPNYRSAMVERLSLQLFLMQSWLDEHTRDFRDGLRTTLTLLDEESPTPGPERSASFTRMTDMTQGMIEKIELANSRFQELSLLGREACEVTRVYKAKLPIFTLSDLKLLQITLAEHLCLKEEPVPSLDAQMAVDRLIDDASLNIRSALDLSGDESLLNLGERIEAMDMLAQQFSAIDQRFIDLVAEYPEHIIADRLEHVRTRVAEFGQDTLTHLTRLLRERRLIEPVPGPSRPVTTPTKKIIKTRFKGTLVGEPRKGADGRDTGLVDVKAPLTGKIIATFHEKTPGVWLRRVTARPAPEKSAPKLADSLASGQSLLDGLAEFDRRIQAQIRRAPRIPAEIQDLYQQHAGRLREVIKHIDQSLLASNRSEERNDAAVTLRNALESAVSTLHETGRTTRIRMVKEQPPTAARVEWLKSEGEVDITKVTTRRRLKGPGKDYLDEYEVLDRRTREVLWYAHFHYASPADPVGSFTAAHLKTVAQRRLGGAIERDSSSQELIAIYRSEISHALASSMFFS
ncbi:dermonecrotic toxin domain-containing protein [Pseudomonas sp. NMS19W]|uniref:dermonecrotic toxin domain-containing protein n=1 Tax=Pseudomonas sp. NMS19W TaxID=3079768 RepID=UPI003F65FC4C